MSGRVSSGLALASVLAIACTEPSPVPEPDRLAPLACPPECETIGAPEGAYLTAGSMAAVRRAAWQLLLPLTTRGSGPPDPAHWRPVNTVFPRAIPARTGPRLKLDVLREEPRTAQEPDLYEATFLNTKAVDFITRQRLNVPSTTSQLQGQLVREIAMPAQSMALKMFFYPLRKAEKVHVRQWDWNRLRVRNGADLDASQMPRQCVQITPAGDDCAAAAASFYTIVVDTSNRSLFTCGQDCPNRLQPDDVLIMVALHLTSKQTPEWLWATFWWRGPDALTGSYWTCHNADRPPPLEHVLPWNQYSMDATASLRLAKPPRPDNPADQRCGVPPALGTVENPDPGRQQFRAAYNPFVEAPLKNGLKANCVNCHARATTTSTVNQKPPSLSDLDSPHLWHHEGHIRLDYLWSITRGLATTTFP